MSHTSTPSRYVCYLCGLPLRWWNFGNREGYKHSGGGRSLSCGRPPMPVTRESYAREIASIVDEIRRH